MAALLLALLVALCGCTGARTPADTPAPTAPVAVAPGAPSSAASTSPSPVQRRSVADAQGAVDRLFAAGLHGDRAAWDAGIAALDAAFAVRSGVLFDNLRALGPTRLEVHLTGAQLQVPPARLTELGPGARVLQARLSWRLVGETRDAVSTVWLTTVTGPRGVRVAGTDDGSTLDSPALPLWWLGPVTRVTRGRVTVLVGPGQDAGRWARLARDAAADTSRHLPRPLRGGWDGRLVVEVPGAQADFPRVLGADPTAYAGTAAVTRPEGPTTRAAVRVVVNPATAKDPDVELATTLTHEAVHVATRSAGSPAPLWAVEGLAEQVALAAHPSERAADLRALRGTRALPARLPADRAFTAGGKDVTTAYAQAWLLCQVVVERRGSAALGHLYAGLQGGRSVDAASRSALGVDEKVLLGWWRSALRQAAAGGRG